MVRSASSGACGPRKRLASAQSFKSWGGDHMGLLHHGPALRLRPDGLRLWLPTLRVSAPWPPQLLVLGQAFRKPDGLPSRRMDSNNRHGSAGIFQRGQQWQWLVPLPQRLHARR
eukprot:scaffold4393_cov153-Pinguiococcus_pyrenoidosus.AAC.1